MKNILTAVVDLKGFIIWFVLVMGLFASVGCFLLAHLIVRLYNKIYKPLDKYSVEKNDRSLNAIGLTFLILSFLYFAVMLFIPDFRNQFILSDDMGIAQKLLAILTKEYMVPLLILLGTLYTAFQAPKYNEGSNLANE